jgi:Protein of unknown function (DUF4238)
MSAGKNISHRHHYVPKFLLEKFTDANGDLWVYDTRLQKKSKAAACNMVSKNGSSAEVFVKEYHPGRSGAVRNSSS